MRPVLKIFTVCCLALVVSSAPDGGRIERASVKKDGAPKFEAIPNKLVSESKPRLASRAERVQPAECPYYVSMQVSGNHDCGGALISKSHVLTAAHCIQPLMQSEYQARQITIEVGSVVIGQGRTHRVKRLSYLRSYEPSNPYSPYIQPNDVAVITLATPVSESAHVRIISLPTGGSEVPAGAVVKVSGFGNAVLNGPTSSVLQKSDLTIVSHGECNSFYSTYMRKSILPNAQICAKGPYGHGACQGDSGGPMVYNNQVVGLVSAGDGNCGAGNPDIYTKVSSFLAYIRSELNGGDNSQSIAKEFNENSGSLYPGQYPATQNEYYPQYPQYPQHQQPSVQYPQTQYPSQYPQTQYPSQYPQTQYPSQYPQTQYPSQYPQTQYPSNEYPSIEYPESPYPSLQLLDDQYPSIQYPGSQYPTGEYPASQYPSGQYPSSSYPISHFPSNQHQFIHYPGSQYPYNKNLTSQNPSKQVAVTHMQLPHSPKITIVHQ